MSTWAQASRARRCLRARDGVDEAAEEGVDHSTQLRGWSGIATLGGDVGHQREGQRVAPGEGKRVGVVRVGDPAPFEEGPAFLPIEVPQLDRLHEPAPPGIRAPGHRGWVAPGQHGDRVRRERREQLLTQPAVQGGQPFGGVDQQEQCADPGDRLARVTPGIESALSGDLGEIGRGDLWQLPRVETHDEAAQFAAQVRVPGEQRRLADAARPGHEQDGTVARALQQGAEGCHLLGPPDELQPSLRGHPLGHRLRHVDLRSWRPR